MSKYAIEFHNVGKQYRLGMVGTGSLQHDINRWWQTTVMRREDPYLKIGDINDRTTKGNSDYVWALKDVSFNVEKGEVVGIIGKNGAGKSTLLKLLSHITAPSTGHIRYRGRIASLLEVGTGFVGDLTARQNIYMNGSIMGMTKREITAKLDEIVDFAGIERYLDTPVKRFSSGMYVRLGFAVAAHLEPEILVVDEVLAVGDAEFQKKAIGKMQDVSRGQGRTVLFVSHNMAAVRKLCTRGIVLQDGEMVFDGGTEEAIEYYTRSCMPEKTWGTSIELPAYSKRDTKISFTSIEFLNENNEPCLLRCGRYVKIRLKATSSARYKGVKVSVVFRTIYDMPVLALPTILTMDEFTIEKGNYTFELTLPKLPLTAGIYFLGVFCVSSNDELYGYKDAIQVEVFGCDYFNTGRQLPAHQLGLASVCDHSWKITQ